MNVGEIDHQLFFHNAKDHAAQDWTPHGANASDDRHQQNGNSCLEGKNAAWASAWIDIHMVAGMKSAGNSRQGSRNGVYP